MKIPLLLAILSFLLFAFTAKVSSSSSNDRDTDIDTYNDTDTVLAVSKEPVFDVNNQAVRIGTRYYIVAANDGTFKGHGFEQSGNLRGKSCPHYNVVLDNSKGSPLIFTYDGGQNMLVEASSYVNIEFSRSAGCNQPLVWKVDNKDKDTNQWFITTGGVKGRYGDKTVRNWFQFVKVSPNIYNIIYCPDKICSNCIPKCQNVSYFTHEKAAFLALSENRPFGIKFEKVP